MTKKFFKSWIALFGLFVLASFFSTDLMAQKILTPEEMLTKLETIAPHRPTMERTTATTDVFYAGQFKYKHTENLNKLIDWQKRYPEEFEAYTPVINAYMENGSDLKLEDQESDIFIDLRAQWALMFNR